MKGLSVILISVLLRVTSGNIGPVMVVLGVNVEVVVDWSRFTWRLQLGNVLFEVKGLLEDIVGWELFDLVRLPLHILLVLEKDHFEVVSERFCNISGHVVLERVNDLCVCLAKIPREPTHAA